MPTIAFDLDGVLADFFEKFIEVYNSRFPVKLSLNQITHYKFHDCLPAAVADEIIKIFHEPGFFTNLVPMPGALDTIDLLLYKGYSIEICTAPPSDYCPRAVVEKWDWVTKYLPKLANCVTVTKNKFYIATDMLVDDYALNIEKWCARHPEGLGFLIDSPWNQNFTLPINCVRGKLLQIPGFIDHFWCSDRNKFSYRLRDLKDHFKKEV